uniref:SSP6 n=1 Tax=Albugo laibachii Nc14 TaxID=890382 RepID=F0WA56_9STRA|nr:SSP6 [Albugo laibachii Nc14]|eukprot:CCA18026.1 SSP6 [Albugo laibachii Nc14]
MNNWLKLLLVLTLADLLSSCQCEEPAKREHGTLYEVESLRSITQNNLHDVAHLGFFKKKMLSLKVWRCKIRKQYARLADLVFELQRQAIKEFDKELKSKKHAKGLDKFSDKLIKEYVEALSANEKLLKTNLEKEYQMTEYELVSPEFDVMYNTHVVRYILAPAVLEWGTEKKRGSDLYKHLYNITK